MIQFEVGENRTIASLTMETRELRAPVGNEIIVRLEASSLNFHDYLVATGAIPVVPGRVPLSDGVGIVESCGPDAIDFKPGDRVMGTFFADWEDGEVTAIRTGRMLGDHVDGFAASHVTMPETYFTRAPAGLSAIESACLPCAGVTAWRAVMVEGRIRPGDTVLVQGSGGVAIFALQIARMAGARVIATTTSQAKADRLLALGASDVIDRTMEPAWGKRARELSGSGVDLVVEVAGGDLGQSLQALRVGGQLCLVGVLSRQPIQFPPIHMIHANRRITGITVGSRKHQADFVRAVELGGLRPVIDSTYPFRSLQEALQHMEVQQHVGKITIDFEK
ncbi:MAG: NAD(P)-dependent alcohol dehydrogenase [Pseudomonadota bacterium]